MGYQYYIVWLMIIANVVILATNGFTFFLLRKSLRELSHFD